MDYYIDTKKKNSSKKITRILKKCVQHHGGSWSEIVFLCIGSDRMTGDCLGPYIGQQLSSHTLNGIYVYGTLFNPVHALNLRQISNHIKCTHPNALIIAIDASLGEKKRLGYVAIGNGSLYPGSGVRKELPPVGDIYITGIVNIGGILEQLTLQTTRLSFVISLADTIAKGIIPLLSLDNIKQML